MATGNMKDIKRRIKSVESTMQITKAMELVASSKLRKAKERADSAEPFFNALYETMCEIVSENPSFLSPYMRRGEGTATLLIVIAGDRGLAGGFNANVLKMAKARADELSEKGSVKIMAIGKKAVDFFEKRDYDLLASYANVAEGLSMYSAMKMADKVVRPYLTGEFARVELFYTQFVSPLVQEATNMQLLPIYIPDDRLSKGILPIYEPSAEDVFNGIVPKYISGIIFGAVVESFASEQAARRTAMESASDNAGEMISSLSLMYNRARQASITQEITEIIGGSAAQSG